jgi:plastocyanin
MPLNFPSSPAVNQVYTEGQKSWRFTGSAWNLITSGFDFSTAPSFTNIAVAGQSTIVADTATDTLTLVGGAGITITTNSGTDTLTINSTVSGIGSLTFNGTSIDSADSSAITFVPAVAFNSDIVVGNEIVFADGTKQATSAVGVPGPAGPPGPPGASGAGTGDVLSSGGGYVDNAIVRYDGTTGTIIQNSSATISDAGLVTATNFSGDGAALTALNATELTSGIIPNARFPSTLPAVSGVNLTALPAILPSSSGVNLTALNASELTSGTVPVLRLGASGIRDATTYLRGDNTWATVAGGGSDSFSTIAVAGQSSVVADSATDTLTLVAGTGISITTVAGTDTITITASGGGASAFDDLTDAVSASLTIDQIYLPAITMLAVTANGTSAYRFDQYGTTDDPTIYAINGTTIAFNLAGASGHPFLIQDNTGLNYDTGLVHVSTSGTVSTGSAAQAKTSGTLYWKIPSAISGNYRYQCQSHLGMVGTITVKNFSVL